MIEPTLKSVKDDLQSALEVEFFTLPPYLYALYSLYPDSNLPSADVVRTVAMEEMLHIVLVGNVLNAIGGAPSFCPKASSLKEHHGRRVEKKFYPAFLPHIESKLSISLMRFCEGAIRQFREIEKPEEDFSTVRPHKTIGAFYAAVRHDLIALCSAQSEEKVFSGDKSKQILPDTFYYGGGGKVIEVHNLASALEALEQVAEQGEGMIDRTNKSGNADRFGQPQEPAHYYRFNQILNERYYLEEDNIHLPPKGRPFDVNWQAVYPARTDPIDPGAHDEMTRQFEQAYDELLERLHRGLNGEHEMLRNAASSMFNLKYSVENLMRKPMGDETAGARFWYIGPPDESGTA